MVIVRLKRMGTTKKPFYRIVVCDKRNARASSYLDLVGYYDPKPQNSVIKFDLEKLEKWLNKGAQMTPNVKSLYRRFKDEEAS